MKEKVVNEFVEEMGVKSFHTSAITGAGVEELFYQIALDFLRKSQVRRKGTWEEEGWDYCDFDIFVSKKE